MHKKAEKSNSNISRKVWSKPEIYKLRVNETLSGSIGNGESHVTHKPKTS